MNSHITGEASTSPRMICVLVDVLITVDLMKYMIMNYHVFGAIVA